MKKQYLFEIKMKESETYPDYLIRQYNKALDDDSIHLLFELLEKYTKRTRRKKKLHELFDRKCKITLKGYIKLINLGYRSTQKDLDIIVLTDEDITNIINNKINRICIIFDKKGLVRSQFLKRLSKQSTYNQQIDYILKFNEYISFFYLLLITGNIYNTNKIIRLIKILFNRFDSQFDCLTNVSLFDYNDIKDNSIKVRDMFHYIITALDCELTIKQWEEIFHYQFSSCVKNYSDGNYLHVMFNRFSSNFKDMYMCFNNIYNKTRKIKNIDLIVKNYKNANEALRILYFKSI